MNGPLLVFGRCPKVGQEVPRGIKKRSLHAPTTECCRHHSPLSLAAAQLSCSRQPNFIARQPLAQFSWADCAPAGRHQRQQHPDQPHTMRKQPGRSSFRTAANRHFHLSPQYTYQDSKFLSSYSLALVDLNPFWLVWVRNRMYCACCFAQTAHNLQLLQLCMQSRQQALIAYCSYIQYILYLSPLTALLPTRHAPFRSLLYSISTGGRPELFHYLCLALKFKSVLREHGLQDISVYNSDSYNTLGSKLYSRGLALNALNFDLTKKKLRGNIHFQIFKIIFLEQVSFVAKPCKRCSNSSYKQY